MPISYRPLTSRSSIRLQANNVAYFAQRRKRGEPRLPRRAWASNAGHASAGGAKTIEPGAEDFAHFRLLFIVDFVGDIIAMR